MSLLIVVDRVEAFRWSRPGDRIVAADEYFRGDPTFRRPGTKVVNLCRRPDYLAVAHFCSMIAEARGQSIVPTAQSLMRFARRELWTEELRKANQALVAAADSPRRGTETFTLFLGETDDPELNAIAEQVYAAFPFPLLRVTIAFGVKPIIGQIVPLTLDDLDQKDDLPLRRALDRFAGRGVGSGRRSAREGVRLAILHDPSEPLPPSRMPTLRKFAEIGAEMDIGVELIRHRDLGRLGEFDALFIRETTAIGNHTYRFAERAERLGIPVIDDPVSIRRCTNKVFLAELLQANEISSPRTWIVSRENLPDLQRTLPFPIVLKKPDGAFSMGVERAASPLEFRSIATRLLNHSELIVAQEFVATDFDWRIGVLAGQPIFAARYFMCPRHWQILKHVGEARAEGETQAVALTEVPDDILRHAVGAARLIGDGLYGVDLKRTDRGAVVIEVNDNPNIEIGLEDGLLGDRLYRRILNRFRMLVARSLEGRHRCATASLPQRSHVSRLEAASAA